MQEACDRHGWPYETYKKHETDPSRRIDPDMVPNYARAYGVNPEWILWGTGAPKWADTDAVSVRQPSPFRAVPRLTMRQAVQLPQDFNRLLKTAPVTPMDSGPDAGPRCFAIPIEDDSMVSRTAGGESFHPGDMIIIDPDRGHEAGDYVLVHLEGDEKATLRKFRPRLQGTYELVPLNDDYAIEEIAPGGPKAEIIGLMIRHIRIFGRRK